MAEAQSLVLEKISGDLWLKYIQTYSRIFKDIIVFKYFFAREALDEIEL